MKTLLRKSAFFFILFFSISIALPAQFVVKVRPTRPAMVVVQPVRPGLNHVWVDGGWIWRGGRYVWADGYWAAPRRGHTWRNGYWRPQRGGYVWVKGNWRRR